MTACGHFNAQHSYRRGKAKPCVWSTGTPSSQKLSWEQLDRKGVSTVLREYYKVRVQ